MKSKKKDLVGSTDIISGLHDALICHILSFLPTKEAASTSVLAKRWKYLFVLVPNLEFDDSSYLHPQEIEENSENFMDFVDSVLALQENAKAPLNRFHLKCKDVSDEIRFLGWIYNVLARGVSDLDIYISPSWDSVDPTFYDLPSKIYVSKTLVRLKIGSIDGIWIDVKDDISLPKLTTLHLDHFLIKINIFVKLLSGCQALEELVLIDLMWDESLINLMLRPKPFSVTLSIPTLKRFRFCRSKQFDMADRIMSWSFDNPNLVYLEYFDTIADRYQQVSFDSIVEASLGLRLTSDQIVKARCATEYYLEPNEKINLTNLLMGIRNVKILYLSHDTLKVLGYCRETIPVFDNMIQLTIRTKPDIAWKSVPALLKSCPNLETLIFEGLHHKRTNRCDAEEDGCLCKYQNKWGSKTDVRTCLSSSPVKVLKLLKFGEIWDDDDEDSDDDYDEDDDGSCDDIEGQIKQVKYFLKTMPSLEQMILYYNTPNDDDVMKVCKELQMLPIVASAKCSVQIISDNLSLSSTMSIKQVIVHLVVHLTEEAKLGGPVPFRWMYPIERTLGHFKSYVRNIAKPEGSICEQYLADECVTFCSMYLNDIETRFTRYGRVDDRPPPQTSIRPNSELPSIFPNLGRFVGAGQVYTLNHVERQQAHQHILVNCQLLDHLREKYKCELWSKPSHQSKRSRAIDIDREMHLNFAKWIKPKVEVNELDGITDDLRCLALGPSEKVVKYTAYNVNGLKFRTIERDGDLKTQNSGVYVAAETMSYASSRDPNPRTGTVAYYGNFVEVIELKYYEVFKVVLFKCKWADTRTERGYKMDVYDHHMVNFSRLLHTGDNEEDEPYILASQAKMVYYVVDPCKEEWNIAVHV